MAEYRMLPLWTDALLGDTQHLSAAEFGAYMLMLIVAWRSQDCALPDDDKYLAMVTRSGGGWKKIRPTVMAFWSRGEDGKLRQKRLSNERAKSQEFRERQVEAGKASALKRKKIASTTVATPVQPPLHSGYNQTPTSVSVSVKKEEESIPPPSPVAARPADPMTVAAGQLRDRLEARLNLATPVILAPIVSWMQAGASAALIEATIDDVLSRMNGRKPDGIGYFGKAVLRAIETAKANGRPGEPPAAEVTDAEAKRIAMKAKADLIAKGHRFGNLEIDDVRGMIRLGWITRDQAIAVGYQP